MNTAKLPLEAIAFGGQVLRAVLPNWGDAFYTSPLSVPEQASATKTPVRGGVPVLFPQFAGDGPLTKHGFVRNVDWLAQQHSQYPQFDAQLELHQPHPLWQHDAQLELQARYLNAHTFEVALNITNTGSTAFEWTGGLHPYFAVDARTAVVQLEQPAQANHRPPHAQSDQLFTVQQMRFAGEETDVLLHTSQAITLTCANKTLRLSSTGFTQWMVWNPGTVLAQKLADLPDDGWQYFVCIEPVCVHSANQTPITVAPGQLWRGTLTIESS